MMQYRINPKNGDKLSALGFGFMRVGRDEAEIERYLVSAIEQGVNYIDTAYIYPGNEATLGRILAKGYRDKVHIATKMPPYLVRKTADFDRLFDTELKRLQTDRIDYYLIHMLANAEEWNRLVGLGILDWIGKKKADGQIKNIGFSYHGGVAAFEGLIDAYSWDFTMIQYNYLDENNQAGKRGLSYAAERGVPVIIMEPLRGGLLATRLPDDAKARFATLSPERTPAEWGLRWVWNHPEVLLLISGMTSQAIVDENIRAAENALPNSLPEDALSVIGEVRDILRARIHVPCTGCGYCMPCPQGVDIPLCFSSYNDSALMSKMMAWSYYLTRNGGHEASRCTGCRKCMQHCPQAIDIPAALKETTRAMERFPYKPASWVIRRVMRSGEGRKRKGTPSP